MYSASLPAGNIRKIRRCLHVGIASRFETRQRTSTTPASIVICECFIDTNVRGLLVATALQRTIKFFDVGVLAIGGFMEGRCRNIPAILRCQQASPRGLRNIMGTEQHQNGECGSKGGASERMSTFLLQRRAKSWRIGLHAGFHPTLLSRSKVQAGPRRG
jgi:hypothetical protein